MSRAVLEIPKVVADLLALLRTLERAPLRQDLYCHSGYIQKLVILFHLKRIGIVVDAPLSQTVTYSISSNEHHGVYQEQSVLVHS